MWNILVLTLQLNFQIQAGNLFFQFNIYIIPIGKHLYSVFHNAPYIVANIFSFVEPGEGKETAVRKNAPNTQTVPTVLNETIYNSLQENAQICSGVMLSMDKMLLKSAEMDIGDLLRLMF